MGINDLIGLGEMVKVASSGVGRVYNDFISIPVNMRRVKMNSDIELEISNDGYKILQKDKEIGFNNVSFEMQQEIIKTKNQLENLNNLVVKLERKGNENTLKDYFSMISESDKVYLLDKYKYEDDEYKINTINEIIAQKLVEENDFSRLVFDFVLSLTKKDIEKLQNIKTLCLKHSQIFIDKNCSMIPIKAQDIKNGKEVLTSVTSATSLFPFISDNDLYKELGLNINWSDIQEFALRGLYTSSAMQQTIPISIPVNDNFLMINIINHNNREYYIDFNEKEIKLSIFLLSKLGNEILEYIPMSKANDTYVDYINDNKILNGKLVERDNKTAFDIGKIYWGKYNELEKTKSRKV